MTDVELVQQQHNPSPAFDPDASVLPDGTRLELAELLQGPLNPADHSVVAGPMAPGDLLAQARW